MYLVNIFLMGQHHSIVVMELFTAVYSVSHKDRSRGKESCSCTDVDPGIGKVVLQVLAEDLRSKMRAGRREKRP